MFYGNLLNQSGASALQIHHNVNVMGGGGVIQKVIHLWMTPDKQEILQVTNYFILLLLLLLLLKLIKFRKFTKIILYAI